MDKLGCETTEVGLIRGKGDCEACACACGGMERGSSELARFGNVLPNCSPPFSLATFNIIQMESDKERDLF